MNQKTEKWLRYALVIFIILLQYPLLFGTSSILNIWRLNKQISAQETENQKLEKRNLALEAEVVDLQRGLDAVEERARSELGMVKNKETFYHIVEKNKK
jgi:cell division protein FtsB